MSTITQERLRELLRYNRKTGVLTWRKVHGRWNEIQAGAVAGWLDSSTGYIRIRIDGRCYWAHRLAWFYVHGTWPPHDIDHRDTIGSHNWLKNLRCLTRAVNLQNKRKANSTSKSGVLGVHWDKARGKWKATISVNNRSITIGRFTRKKDARAAYLAKKRELHEGNTL